jgi:hypothetical protein
MASRKKLRLVPELVPRPLWGRSPHRMRARRFAWTKKIRPDALAKAKNCCSICGSGDGRLICHDLWHYDDKAATATLVGFEIHCGKCDAATHSGRLMNKGLPKEVEIDALKHFCSVNRCTPKVFRCVLESAMDQWHKRSEKQWTVKVAAPLIERYPELAALPDFVPPPMRF